MTSGVSSIREFMEMVWQAEPDAETGIMLFRGQAHNWPLLPKLFRWPNTPEMVEANEQKMFHFLMESASHLRPSQPESAWDWLSLGQHFGMSTRLSDWSANPLIALFFSVESGVKEGEQPVVFQYPVREEDILKKREEGPFFIPHTRVMRPSSHSIRSQAQAAWHLAHAIHTLSGGIKSFLVLDTMPPHNSRLKQITISPDAVQPIQKELEIWGIDHSTVYGDFASVCKSIASRFGLA